jgi:hypothetical protein
MKTPPTAGFSRLWLADNDSDSGAISDYFKRAGGGA